MAATTHIAAAPPSSSFRGRRNLECSLTVIATAGTSHPRATHTSDLRSQYNDASIDTEASASKTDEKQRGRAAGIWAAGASIALTAGPLLGGALIALVGWRLIFFVNLPIGLAGLWLSWCYATETTRSPQREIDLPGQCDRHSI
jgi:hypothetical protein